MMCFVGVTYLNFKLIKLMLLTAFAILLLASCGGGSDSDSSSSSSTITNAGVAQKGPFSIGSNVVINKLDSSGVSTGSVIEAKIYSKSGGFSYQTEGIGSNAYYRIQVKGRFLNENTGSVSEDEITLSTITNNPNNSSINVLTHWLSQRVDALLASDKSLKISLDQSLQELIKLFGIENPNALDVTTNSDSLDQDNAMLLLLSGALMEVSQKYKVSSQTIINDIGNDFADDGQLTEKGDDWFIRLQALIKDNPSAHTKKYAKVINKKLGYNVSLAKKLPKLIPLASRPVANLPSELLAKPGEIITLDGSASNDSGEVINFTWFRVDQQTQYNIQVSDRFSAKPTITVPDEATVLAAPNQEISLLYALVVTDVDKLTHTAVVKVTIKVSRPLNTAPVADSQTLETAEDTPLFITLTADDEDGDPINFILSTPLLTPSGLVELDSSLPNIVYTPTQDYSGPDSFTFLVNDGSENSNTATIDIQVTPINDPPLADAGFSQTVESLQIVNLDGSESTDVDGTVDAYLWQQQLTGSSLVSLSSASVFNPSFNAPSVSSVAETLTFNLVVTDNEGANSIADTVDIVVNPLNEPPVANAGIDQEVNGGELVTLNGSGTDVDGTVDGYLWTQSAGSTLILSDNTRSNPTFSAPVIVSAPETFTFDLIVTDDDGAQSVVDSVDILVNQSNQVPVADAGPDQSITSIRINVGGGYLESTPEIILDGSGSTDIEDDLNSVPLTYNWIQVSGPVSIDPDDLVMSAISINGDVNIDIDGIYVFRLTVTDSGGLTSDFDDVTITVSPTPTAIPPIADNLTVPIDLFGNPTDITLMGNDPDGNNTNLVYEIVTLPGFGNLNVLQGPIAGNVNNVEYLSFSIPSTDSFTYRVRDEDGLVSNLATVNLTVPNAPPTANSFSVSTNQGFAISINEGPGEIEGFDIDGGTLTVVDVTDPTSGTLVITTSGGVNTYTYTPDASFFGIDTFTYKIFDGIDNSAIATVTINVNARPIANAGSDRTVTQGDTVTLFGANSRDEEGPIKTYEWLQQTSDRDQVILVNADTENPSFSAPGIITSGPNKILNFDLYVTDSEDFRSLVDSVRVTVTELCVTDKPIASTGVNRNVLPGMNVVIYGFSDIGFVCDNESSPRFTWVQVDTPPDQNVNLVTPPFSSGQTASFVAPNVTAITEFNFQLIASQDGAVSDPVFMTVTVHPTSVTLPTNLAPTATSNNSDYNVEVLGNGDIKRISLRATDPDGDDQGLSYRIVSSTSSGVLDSTNASNGSVTYTPVFPVNPLLNDSFTFIATDQNGLDSAPLIVNISRIAEPVGNNAPVATGGTFTGRSIDDLLRIRFDDFVEESDVDDFYRIIEINKIENNLMFEELSTFIARLTLTVNNLDMPNLSSGEYEFIAVDKFGRESDRVKFIVIFNGANAPTAIPGADRVVAPGERLTLFGDGTDIDGTIGQFGYRWTQTQGTDVGASGSSRANLFFNAPNITSGTEVLIFELVVTDDEGYKSEPVSIQITVDVNAIPNNTPTANAFTIDVNQDSSVVIPQGPGQLGGIDLDGDPLTLTVPNFSLRSQGEITVENTGSGDVYTYTPNAGICGAHSFDYTVSDGLVISRSSRVTINVNCPPEASDLGDFTIDPSGVDILLSGTDPGGSIVSYEIISAPINGTFDAGVTLPNLLYIPNNLSSPVPDQFSFRVIDNQGLPSEPQTVNLIVGNGVPVTISDTFFIPAGAAEAIIDLNNYASDPDGDSFTFEIVGEISSFSFTLSATFEDDGLVTGIYRRFRTPSFQFRVIDDKGAKSNIATIILERR